MLHKIVPSHFLAEFGPEGDGQAPDATPSNGNGARTAALNAKTINQDEHEAAVARAREETEQRLRGSIEREKAERKRLQAEVDGLKRTPAPSPADDAAVQGAIQSMRDELARTNQVLRATALVAYRERVLRNYGADIFPDMVVGSSEEELDESADRAHKAFKDMRAQIRADMEKEFASKYGGPPPTTQPTLPASMPTLGSPAQAFPQAFVPPPNPSYPVMPQQFGLPAVTNPEPVAAGPAPMDLRDMTSEQAVRTGRYGGEMRERILSQLKGQSPYMPNLGSTPRHVAGLPQMQMPGGAVQPQGTPVTAPINPQMQQYAPQVAVPGPPPVGRTVASGG